jgi:hypothetical protein
MNHFESLYKRLFPSDLCYYALHVKHFSLGLFFLLGDEGDACLIPAPYYAAFENDMRIVARIVPFAVQMANPTQGPSASELDLAYIEAKSVSSSSYEIIVNLSLSFWFHYHESMYRVLFSRIIFLRRIQRRSLCSHHFLTNF